MSNSQLRNTGIDIIGTTPWSLHFCQFYDTKQDLIDILVPYFKAGLENNELCTWVTSEPLHKEEAKQAMRKAVPVFDQCLKRGQIEIIPYSEFYLKGGAFNGPRVLNAWLDKLKKALAKGYDGIRITGNLSWLEEEDWISFTEYEKEVNRFIGGHNMLVLCTYPLAKCKASAFIDVIGNHRFTLIKQAGNWVLEGHEYKQAEEELFRLSSAVSMSSDGIAISNIDGKIIYVNEATLKMYGTDDPNDLIGKSSFALIAPEDQGKAFAGMQEVMEKGYNKDKEYHVITKNSSKILTKMSTCLVKNKTGEAIGFAGTFKDITKQKQMEEKHQAIVETALDGFWIISLEGRLLEVNDSYCKIIGYTREELLKMSIADIEAVETSDDTARHIKKVMEQGYDHFETKHKRKDGKITDVDVSVTYIDIGGGQLLAFLHDITKRKQAEKTLWEREEKVKRIFESVKDAVIVTDLNGVIVDLNEGALRMSGFGSKSDLVGKSAIETIVSRDRERALEDMQELARQGVVGTREYTLNKADGSEYAVEISADVLKDTDGNTVGFVSAIRDITERKRMEEIQKTSKAITKRGLVPLEDRFQKYGIKGFSDPEIIELILGHNMPGKECKKLVSEITKRYGTLREFLAAPIHELEQIPGMNPRSILCIKIIREVPKVFLKEKIIEKPISKSSREVFNYLYYSMRDLKKEVFTVVYLDSRNQIIDTEELFQGTLDGIHIYPREIEECAIKHKATGLIFVHNHTSGDCTPSLNDKQITRDLVFIGKVLQIKVLDHIIIGENRYYSFADAGLIEKYEDDFINLRLRRFVLQKV